MTTPRTNSPNEFSTPTASYFHDFFDISHLVNLPETLLTDNSRVVLIRPREVKPQKNLKGGIKLTDVISEFTSTDGGKEAMVAGRKRIAETMYRDEPNSLQALRLKLGLKQEDLGALLRLPQSRISIYERGIEQPGFDIMKRMASVFGVDMNTLASAIEYAKNRGQRRHAKITA